MDWFDMHAGFLTVLVTLVLVLVTAYYAKQAHDQATIADRALAEARRLNADQVAAQFRPMLVPVEMALQLEISWRPAMVGEGEATGHLSQLIIENIGVGPALNVAAQVVRKDVPGQPQPVVMLQFGETRIGNIGAARQVQARVIDSIAPFLVLECGAPGTDELVLEYESLGGRCYQTIVERHRGRWRNYRQVVCRRPSSREIDPEQARRRSELSSAGGIAPSPPQYGISV
jgi:hypothetical protein